MRVVWVILDALPRRHISAATPHLAHLSQGGNALATVRGVLTAATYPNHATFATGLLPMSHGIIANNVFAADRFQPAAATGPRGATLASQCAAAGRTVVACVGDHHLVGVMGLQAADSCWPAHGVLPAGVPLDAAGYAADEAVIDQIEGNMVAELGEVDLLLVHLNGPDTAAHLHGPDSDAARAHYQGTDRQLGRLVELLAPRWDDTVLLITSDHDQEAVLDDQPIDLCGQLERRGVPWTVTHEGSAALVHRLLASDRPPRRAAEPLPRLQGEAGRLQLDRDTVVVWSEPGRWFSEGTLPLRGVHGSPRTVEQFGVVAGGHPAAAALRRSMQRDAIVATDWCPTVLSLLGVAAAPADGRALLEPIR